MRSNDIDSASQSICGKPRSSCVYTHKSVSVYEFRGPHCAPQCTGAAQAQNTRTLHDGLGHSNENAFGGYLSNECAHFAALPLCLCDSLFC